MVSRQRDTLDAGNLILASSHASAYRIQHPTIRDKAALALPFHTTITQRQYYQCHSLGAQTAGHRAQHWLHMETISRGQLTTLQVQ